MSCFNTNLRDYILNTTDITQLIPILKRLSLESVKMHVNTLCKELNPDEARHMYYNAIPINEALPDDLTQKILSYNGFYHPKKVCKHWKKLSEMNETNHFRQRFAAIKSNVPQNSYGTTYIVTQIRKPLLHIDANAREVCINNIKFHKPVIEMMANTEVQITDCEFFESKETALMVNKGVDLLMHNCLFSKTKRCAIQISPVAGNIAVSQCTFENCGRIGDKHGCITVVDSKNERGTADLVSLRCVGNMFVDNKCYPMIELSSSDKERWISDQNGNYVFENNFERKGDDLTGANFQYFDGVYRR